MRDLHNKLEPIRGTLPVAVGTTGTGQVGKVFDRRDYDAIEFYIQYGAITATNAVFTVIMKEGDVTGTMTSVADADMLSTEALAGIAATASRVSGVSKIVNKRIGYIGVKRYLQLTVKSTITAGTPIAVLALGGRARREPVA